MPGYCGLLPSKMLTAQVSQVVAICYNATTVGHSNQACVYVVCIQAAMHLYVSIIGAYRLMVT